MVVFWVWRLLYPPLWCLISSSISWWWWVRVQCLWHWEGTNKNSIFLHITSMTLVMVFYPVVSFFIVPLPWHGDQIQQLIAPQILDQASQIRRGGSSWSLIREIIGSHPLVKNSLVSSKTCQVVWANLIRVNFDLTALSKGWFNTLHNFTTWLYRGHTSSNNTHNNAEKNVANIYFNS